MKRVSIVAGLLAFTTAVIVLSAPQARGQQRGWIPQKRSGTQGSGPADFDWTGLLLRYDAIMNIGIPYSYTSTAYAGLPNILTGGYVGGSAGSNLYWKYTLNGTSTFKWLWTPPLVPAIQLPDYANFPAPEFYVLGDVSPQVGVGVLNPSNLAGLTDMGSVADGWGWTVGFTNVLPASAPASGINPRRNVLKGSPGNLSVVTLSPTASVQVNGQLSGGSAYCSIGLLEGAYPITLLAPNPFGLPTFGDGKNQFVYDGATIDFGSFGGYLQIPLSVKVGDTVFGNASLADTTWLLPSVDWTIDITTGYQFSFSKQAVVGGLYPVSQFGPSGALAAYFVYRGLPTNNSSFGNHTATLIVNGHNSQLARIQTFFTSTAKNWPGADPTLATTPPNWFTYYNQVYPSPGAYTYTGSSRNESDLFGHRYILIGDDAHGPYNVRVFDIQVNPTDGKRYIHYAGVLEHRGIHTYIYVCGHEQGHFDHYQNGIENSSPDTDGDGVNDDWERRNNLDPTKFDTARAYLNLPSTHGDYHKGDREALCDMDALGKLLPNKDKWMQDWANDGVQWGAWGQRNPNFASYYGMTPMPYHPWNYTIVIGVDANGNPISSGSLPDPPGSVLSNISQLDGGGH